MTKKPTKTILQPATGPWQYGEAPKDGSYILGYWNVGGYALAAWSLVYKKWKIKGVGRRYCIGEPQCWARINAPEVPK